MSKPSSDSGGVHHELSPLLISSASSATDIDKEETDGDGDDNNNPLLSRRGGSATVLETILNLAKTCMGTGCLALPFAAQQGGLLLFIFGTYGIAAWNCYAVQRLCQSGDRIHRVGGSSSSSKHLSAAISSPVTVTHDHDSDVESVNDECPPSSIEASSSLSPSHSFHPAAPPPGTATLGKVAWYALGPLGLIVVDIMMVTLLLGIVVTYQDAMLSFIHDTPFTTGWKVFDAIIIAMIVAPLSVVPNTGYLAKVSAFGLTTLGVTLAVIAGNGIIFYDNSTSIFTSLHWLPQEGLTGISRWYGCLVFGFGVVPMTFNYQESMAEPTQMIQANKIALFGVASTYIGVGVFLSILYPNIPGDVLHELPPTGIIPTLTRLAMVVVVLATTPLIIVPCAELLEGKIIHQLSVLGVGSGGGGGGIRLRQTSHPHETEQFVKVVVRFGISFATAGVSVGIPSFVEALSFVGCFCVALVSFCVPPLLHFMLLLRGGRRSSKICRRYSVDAIMLGWGLAATFITTVTTLHKMTTTTSSEVSASP